MAIRPWGGGEREREADGERGMASDSPGGVPLLSAQIGDEAALTGCILIAN